MMRFEGRKASGLLFWRCAFCGKDHEYQDQHQGFHVSLGNTVLFIVDRACVSKAHTALEALIGYSVKEAKP